MRAVFTVVEQEEECIKFLTAITVSVSFPCGPENADKLTKSAIAEVQKLIDKGPEQKDLDKYKEGELQ
jgi:zinc protease